MTRKRKRTSSSKRIEGDQKRQKTIANRKAAPSSKYPIIKHALLAQYYREVLSLREYLLSRLPTTSKVRRKKLLSVGRRLDDKDIEKKLSSFLDSTLIGVLKCNEVSQEERWQQWTTFSQKADDSISCINLNGVGVYSQSEVRVFYFALSWVLRMLLVCG